jgi:hypothetical protein
MVSEGNVSAKTVVASLQALGHAGIVILIAVLRSASPKDLPLSGGAERLKFLISTLTSSILFRQR